MPVDYTGALVALLLWIAGVWWLWARAARITRDQPQRSFRAIFWTIWMLVGLSALVVCLAWFYDWTRSSPWL